jgi:hypothetical protein
MARTRKPEHDWSLSDEREFTENLFNQRLNFYFVVYPIIITGAFATEQPRDRILVLRIGILLCAVLGFSIYRACHKLMYVLKRLHRTRGHPVRLSGRLARMAPWPLSFPVNHLLGIWMPVGSILVLVYLLMRTMFIAWIGS